MEIIPVIHNVSSVQRIVDTARLVYSMGLNTLVVSKAYGGAAQSGVPEAMKLALKMGRTLVVLPDLSDAIDLLQPETVVLITRDFAKERVKPSQVEVRGKTMIVVSGSEPEFSPQELRLGRPLYIAGLERKVGAVAELALMLYGILVEGESRIG